jgi:2-phospho-L-lactate/phosphoenolpyruvate guanylyltransferase
MPFRCVSAKTASTPSRCGARLGIEPLIIRQPGIGMDTDHPVDLVAFLRMSPTIRTRTLAFLEQSGIAGRVLAEEKDAR